MNKYEQTPEYILDLHGYTVREAQVLLDALLKERRFSHVRIITGKGLYRQTGPVLKTFVRQYFVSKNLVFRQSKLHDGGDGAFELFLT